MWSVNPEFITFMVIALQSYASSGMVVLLETSSSVVYFNVLLWHRACSVPLSWRVAGLVLQLRCSAATFGILTHFLVLLTVSTLVRKACYLWSNPLLGLDLSLCEQLTHRTIGPFLKWPVGFTVADCEQTKDRFKVDFHNLHEYLMECPQAVAVLGKDLLFSFPSLCT